MSFTPSNPIVSVTTIPSAASSATTWANDSITEVFDVLTDIAGNYIVDTAGNYISLGGGVVPNIGLTSGTWGNGLNTASTWTAEG